MFFEVNITPKAKTAPVHTDLETRFDLLLAPFQPQTHIGIETALNTTACCYVTLKNPSSRSLSVQITKTPPQERLVAVTLDKLKIEPEEHGELVVSWTARKPGTFRDIIQLTDSRHIKYDIALTTSTTGPKKSGGCGKPRGTKSQASEPAKKVLMQNVSPNVIKKSETKRICNASENVADSVGNAPSTKRHKPSTLKYQGKENVANHQEINWQTPKKSSSSTLTSRQDKADLSAGKLRDFSMLIESDTFALTPPPWIRNDRCKLNSGDDDSQFATQSYTALLSPSRSGPHELRRETYVTAPACSNVTFINDDVKEGFEDSLSPREAKQPQNSDFSMLINNLNFTPAPATVKHEISLGGLDTPTSAKNNTFEVIKSAEIKEAVSLAGPTEIHRLIPTRLSRNFARLSPVMPVVEQCLTKFATSSSPICENVNEELDNSSIFRSRIDGFNIQRKTPDVSSVQEILEADLWAKPVSQCSFNVGKSGPTSLESIKEEIVTPITNKTYVKSIDRTQTWSGLATPTICRLDYSMSNHSTNNPLKKTSPIRKISPKKYSKVSKDRSISEIHGLKKKASMNTSLKSGGKVSIPGVRITKLSLAGVSRPKKTTEGASRGFENEVSMKLHNPDDFFTILCNPDPFAATTTEDPFLASTLYYDDRWVENQEIEFKKWLNALLTPPEHLTSNVDTPLADVAKIWQSCRLKEDVSLAETKEAVSARYHTNQRLNTLRRAACTMLRSNEVVAVLSRVTVCIEKGNLVIRQDRDLHKDIGLQKLVLELLLCYNPLWLRIGLEAIYGETIPLNSNNDIIRLSKFLLTRFFSDPYIVKTHSHQTVLNLRLPTFLSVMNKFMLKKFLFIVYFLDYAKTHKLIGHDPCLFHKQASHKESKRILLKFSQELLSGVGDVTKVLKPYGYVLTHKQTEIDEYSYAVNNLSLDLRDGVRLCRVMELITGKRNLTAICRVPAISRLQKVYNVDVALKALTSSDYVICGNITAKCIADGHREKTLSLLWQIIYKFQAPHFNKAAATIQKWWRSKLWWVRVKNFLLKRKNDAASVIQRAWRSYRARKELRYLKENRVRILVARNGAARVIQLRWISHKKMLREKERFQQFRSSALIIQRSWRNHRATKPFVTAFKRKQSAVRIIQGRWRATKSMRDQISWYLIQRDAIVKIQEWWRRKLAQKAARDNYLTVRKAVKLVQSKWRSNRLMKIQRQEYLRTTNAVRVVQQWWRREMTYRRDRNRFLLTKDAIRCIEKWWLLHSARGKLSKQETNAAIILQRKWRAIRAGRQQRRTFETLRKSVVTVQRKWRANRTAKSVQESYILQKKSAIVLQQRFRALRAGRQQRQSFTTLKKSVVTVQRKWRANEVAKSVRQSYLLRRNAAMVIQSYWRDWRVGFETRCAFLSLKAAAVCVQDRFRAKKAARQASEDFSKLKQSVIIIQRRWRARRLGREARQEFLSKRKAAVVIQRKYQTIIMARKYQARRQAVLKIQLWWKACIAAKESKSRYDLLKSTAISVQRKYRARKLGVSVRKEFLTLKTNVVSIQRKWRAKRLMQPHREEFLARIRAVNKIQLWWKACVIARQKKSYYNLLKSKTIFVQRKYRARKTGASVRGEFLTLRNSIVYIQEKWRANRSMKLCREDYLSKREAASKIQLWWRACVSMRKTKTYYDKLKSTTILIQKKYRARRSGAFVKREFDTLKSNVIYVQQKWRAKKLMQSHREYFLSKRRAAINIQSWWTACSIAKKTKAHYDALKSLTVLIQRNYRARKLGASVKRDFETLRSRVIWVQQKWRANRLMRLCRKDYLTKRRAVLTIQSWLRAVTHGRIYRVDYLQQKIAAIQIQRWYRGAIMNRKLREDYKICMNSIISIQSWWREILSRRLKIKQRKASAATLIQAVWKGHKVRQSQSKQMAELRGRAEKAAMEAQPSETLGHRLNVAIINVQEYESLGKLTQGLTALDTITHLLPLGCISLCNAGLVPRLYDLIHRSNRSRPWMDICLRASSILVSITKYSPTKSYAWQEQYIEAIIQLLSSTVERETSVFLNTATLLWLLADTPDRIKVISESPLSARSLSTMYNVVNKKKSNNRLSLGTKSSATTCMLPNPKPDWGLKHSRPRLFRSVHHAVVSLCKRLKIKPTQ